MLCITADPKTIEHIPNSHNVEIIYHDLEGYDSFDKITLLGIELERLIIDKTLIWSTKPCTKILFIWEKLDADFDNIISHTEVFRSDEMLIKDSFSVNWVLGNPRAIIKWAASISKLKELLPQRTIYPRTDNTRKLIWWAMRLDLKLYVLPK